MNKRITRRKFVTDAAAGAALSLACVAEGENVTNGSAPARPNILIIHVDQQRIETLGAYGNTDIRTPYTDALAADGVRYTNSFCPFPVCTPSRYSFLTGRYVFQHRGHSNHCTLEPGSATFPSILRAAGYRTKAVGKMHFTPTYADVGFDELVLAEQNGPGRFDDDYHRLLREHGLVDRNDLEDQESEWREKAREVYWETFGALESNLPIEFHSTTWTGDRAVETLEQWTAGGNCLMAGFIKPHHPFDPPKEYADAYDPAKLDILPGWTDECFAHDLALGRGYFPHEELTLPALRRVMAYYYAAIEHIDTQAGRMIAVLKRKGLYDNALIIYTSDHGEYMGCHHMLLKGNYMYDPVVKVPLIVKHPGQREAGHVSHDLVNNIDVAPTILAAAGCQPAPAMIGRALGGTAAGPEYVFSESHGLRMAMVRSKTRKLIVNERGGHRFFYDLENDPAETKNVCGDANYREEISAFEEALKNWRPIDELPEPYVDERAPVINQPNVPERGDGHREEMLAYFRAKMAEFPAR